MDGYGGIEVGVEWETADVCPARDCNPTSKGWLLRVRAANGGQAAGPDCV